MTDYVLTRSKRKSIAIRIGKDLQVLVRAPLRTPVKEIEACIRKHTRWIESHKRSMNEFNRRRGENVLSPQETEALKNRAREALPQRVAYFSERMGLTPAGIKITSAKTRWGSCSAKNSLCFSYRLMLLPSDVIDYIVVHELAHIKVKNHSAAFYGEIARHQPDYKERVAKLKRIQRELPLCPEQDDFCRGIRN